MLGAGAWGTALALQLAGKGLPVLLWSHRDAHYQAMLASGSNPEFLPDLTFPAGLSPTGNLEETVTRAGDLVLAVPSAAFRGLVRSLRDFASPRNRIAWGTKGLEGGSHELLHEVMAEELGTGLSVAVISGPTFAREVARGLPAALTVASPDLAFADELAHALATDRLLTFTSSDLIGVEVGGATKNVIAIGAGVADALGCGGSARAALVTRGLAEMVRLGEALGARRSTFTGLSGLGDLILTCCDDRSRNRRFGLALGRGLTADAAESAVGQVVEGRGTARSVRLLAREMGVRMPICEQVYRVTHEGRPPGEAVSELLAHGPTPEKER